MAQHRQSASGSLSEKEKNQLAQIPIQMSNSNVVPPQHQHQHNLNLNLAPPPYDQHHQRTHSSLLIVHNLEHLNRDSLCLGPRELSDQRQSLSAYSDQGLAIPIPRMTSGGSTSSSQRYSDSGIGLRNISNGSTYSDVDQGLGQGSNIPQYPEFDADFDLHNLRLSDIHVLSAVAWSTPTNRPSYSYTSGQERQSMIDAFEQERLRKEWMGMGMQLGSQGQGIASGLDQLQLQSDNELRRNSNRSRNSWNIDQNQRPFQKIQQSFSFVVDEWDQNEMAKGDVNMNSNFDRQWQHGSSNQSAGGPQVSQVHNRNADEQLFQQQSVDDNINNQGSSKNINKCCCVSIIVGVSICVASVFFIVVLCCCQKSSDNDQWMRNQNNNNTHTSGLNSTQNQEQLQLDSIDWGQAPWPGGSSLSPDSAPFTGEGFSKTKSNQSDRVHPASGSRRKSELAGPPSSQTNKKSGGKKTGGKRNGNGGSSNDENSDKKSDKQNQDQDNDSDSNDKEEKADKSDSNEENQKEESEKEDDEEEAQETNGDPDETEKEENWEEDEEEGGDGNTNNSEEHQDQESHDSKNGSNENDVDDQDVQQAENGEEQEVDNLLVGDDIIVKEVLGNSGGNVENLQLNKSQGLEGSSKTKNKEFQFLRKAHTVDPQQLSINKRIHLPNKNKHKQKNKKSLKNWNAKPKSKTKSPPQNKNENDVDDKTGKQIRSFISLFLRTPQGKQKNIIGESFSPSSRKSSKNSKSKAKNQQMQNKKYKYIFSVTQLKPKTNRSSTFNKTTGVYLVIGAKALYIMQYIEKSSNWEIKNCAPLNEIKVVLLGMNQQTWYWQQTNSHKFILLESGTNLRYFEVDSKDILNQIVDLINSKKKKWGWRFDVYKSYLKDSQVADIAQNCQHIPSFKNKSDVPVFRVQPQPVIEYNKKSGKSNIISKTNRKRTTLLVTNNNLYDFDLWSKYKWDRIEIPLTMVQKLIIKKPKQQQNGPEFEIVFQLSQYSDKMKELYYVFPSKQQMVNLVQVLIDTKCVKKNKGYFKKWNKKCKPFDQGVLFVDGDQVNFQDYVEKQLTKANTRRWAVPKKEEAKGMKRQVSLPSQIMEALK